MKSGGSGRIEELWPVLAVGLAVAWFFAPLLLGQAMVAEPDAVAALLPLKAFLARAITAGEWPLWNPNAALGKPFLPDLLAGALYPPNLLLAVPPFERGLNWLFVAHYAWTALGAVLALRACGLPRAAALLGALVWTFGGTMISLGNVLNQLLSAAWLPWVLWGWLRPRALALKVALAAAAMGLALLAGGVEMVLVSAVALLVVSRHPASLLVPPLAFVLAAVELLPFYFFLTETWRGAYGFDPAAAMKYSVPPADLVQLARDGWRPSPERFMPQIYVGPAVLILALAGLLTARTMRWLWIAVAVGAVLVVMGSHTPVYPFLYAHMPLSNLLRYPEKLFLGVHALLAGSAAFGCAALAAVLARFAGSRRGARAATALALALCVLVFADLVRANRDALFAPRPSIILDPPPVARALLAHHAAQARAGADTAPSAAPRIYSNPHGRPIPRSLPAAVALDRNLPWGAVGELYGLANVNSPSSLNLVKHEALQRALAEAPRDRSLGALAALGTEYVTSWARIDDQPAVRAIPIPGERIGVKLYQLLDAQPRAFVASRVREARDADQALQRFVAGDGGAHAGLALVVPDALPRVAFADRPAPAGSPASPPRFLAARSHRLEIEADMPAAGLLVVNDTMLAGWQASVDGAPAPLVEVNGQVRGVWLERGRHRVEMRYRPPGLLAGAAMSLAGMLVLAGAVWSSRRRWAGGVVARPAQDAPHAVSPERAAGPVTAPPRRWFGARAGR